ncbi:dTDP-4-dehydrorhamnose 3,5-epimerase [Mucilaginibacter sp. OK098]|uniref:dTDP-4-dehydrorhamnose 3,5-epimerase n=1 Tax=Mucilaginibacter sp. OK098 TaxID=1855297 RepID=UPI00091DFAF2|nr:dTDP-4-dehydrorhamnose 3,5-epimerase [Mucilaginibacter sp. OK098]SHN19981.1 dTDP-4-dehydrorhamnose 3,5-epimerase [Mucilaginibacter sp. OK098]
MKVTKTDIEGLLIIDPSVFSDDRGYFFESYNQAKYKEAGIAVDFIQDNQSFSRKGTVRALHGQADPFAQGKLVRVITGRVLDVAVDIRKASPTYGKHFSIELSGDNQLQFWVPAGFLHGFSVLEDNTTFAYKVNNYYDKASELGVIWNDPTLNIDWGLAPGEALLSHKDVLLSDFKSFISPF